MSSIRNHVKLSPSGLLVEIETYDGDRLTGSVQIHRRAWPTVVEHVEQCFREASLMAEVRNIVTGASDEESED